MASFNIARAYVLDKAQYGNVERPNTLRLSTYAPTLSLDDGSKRAYFGKFALQKVADPEAQKTLEGDSVQIPMDVKLVGYQYLTALGVPAEAQQSAMAKWMSLPQASQLSYISTWESLDKSDAAAVNSFVQGLFALLVA